MKKLLFAIFAHPDDEAFGPSATLMKEVASGTEVHTIFVTDGDKGSNPDKVYDLGHIRRHECHTACQLIGATSMEHLGYGDGTLSNDLYQEIAEKIEALVRKTCENSNGTELCLMTFDPNGVSGHLDHIAVSFITTHAFYKLKAKPPQGVTTKELAYFCLSTTQQPEPDGDYFVFMPAGRPKEYINRTVDVRELLPKKYEVMRVHRSQRHDAEELIGRGDDFHATDNFHVISA